MNHDTEHARYIPLTQPGLDRSVLLLDSHAPLKDLHAFAETRISLATRFLDTLAHMNPTHTDESDITTLASTAHLLMLEACDVNRVIEKRLWKRDDSKMNINFA
ncbi:hypothetical protein [Pseudomonas folii]|uniref:DUF3077 domain-containing protein n=1 Tax=Pseudomonas folii TaxID=2762593 RepID=A0ABR7AUR5_9PSED|nr:hypothetical protein [Pseudomonas folii]MBC3948653.1 hypothetical protein [Pseudomonas folii]